MDRFTLRQAISHVQEIGREYNFTIVIVGGSLVRLIGAKTKIKSIDTKDRVILLEFAENPGIRRSEDTETIVDIDCIAFSNASDPFTKEVENAFVKLKQQLRILQRNTYFPAVSLEPVLYHPYFSKPNPLIQFVSSIESYHDHNFFFRLGSVKCDVSRQSLTFWTYTFSETNESFTSFSPLAVQRRYLIRGFTVKPKDQEKIFGRDTVFAKFIDSFNHITKKTYEKDFITWDEFETAIRKSNQPSMRLKRSLWNLYWNTIGTYLAHGTGIMGKLLLPLGNTFFAGK